MNTTTPDPNSHVEAAPLEGLEPADWRLLQACVGFHAKQQTDPAIRDRLYRLWVKLNVVCQAAG